MEMKAETKPLWPKEICPPATYPWLYQNEKCEVLIIGGGILGAFTAHALAQSGADTVLISESPIGYGGTSYSNGVMYYDDDIGLEKAGKLYGSDHAAGLFQLRTKGMDELESLIQSLPGDTGYRRSNCLTMTFQEGEAADLHREYLLRRHNQFDVEFFDSSKEQELFSFDIPAGILGKSLAAVVDPYRLTHALLQDASNKGVRIYENTSACEIHRSSDSSRCYEVECSGLHLIEAEKIILTAGLGCEKFVPLCNIRTSFSIATAPIDSFTGWPEKCLIRTLGSTQIECSITPDNRILITGLDSGLIHKNGRLAGLIPLPALEEKKYQQLSDILEKLFPGIRGKQPKYQYTGRYLKTDDGLPVIGELKDYDGAYFAVCSERNSTLYAFLSSRLLLELYHGKTPEILHWFSPERQ